MPHDAQPRLESVEGDSEGQSSQNALRRAKRRLLRFLKVERRSLKLLLHGEQFGNPKDHTVKHPTGMPGLAVVANTAYGDGMYPVLGLYEAGEESTGRPHAMMVVTGDVDA